MQLLVMGVVNVTPDSFSDGGQFFDPGRAIDHGHRLITDGADILDIGGEATNPKAQPIDADEELRRIIPVIEALAPYARISVDTTKSVVARVAVAAGATIVNDVSGGLFDPEMASTLDQLPDNVTYIAGHLRGRSLGEVFTAEVPLDWRVVADELRARVAALSPKVQARTWIDPGIGFGKGADPTTNFDLLRQVRELSSLVDKPVVVGPSRKRFLARVVAQNTGIDRPDPHALDVASVSACLLGARSGAQCVRIHNVALLRDALALYNKI